VSAFVSLLRFLAAGLLPVAGTAAAELRLIGVAELAPRAGPAGERVGGLSGLDYDASANRWLAASDERVAPAPAWWLAIDYDAASVGGVRVLARTTLPLPPDGAPDVEGVRFDPAGGGIWYAGEGDAARGAQPFLARLDEAGAAPVTFPLPAGFAYRTDGRTGLRPNLAVEGFTFVPGTDTRWIAAEAPLIEDGAPADFARGALVRLTEQRRSGETVRQLAYPLDPVPAALAGGRRESNGVAEILALEPGRLLVLERAGAEFPPGEWRFAVRLYEADLTTGTELDPRALAGRAIVPVRKRLLYDFAAAGRRVDNIEGLARGRPLADGTATLVAVSDDNFSPHQTTQVWVFARIASPQPPPAAP